MSATAIAEYRIAAGDITAVVSTAGGAIRSLEYRRRPLLRSFAEGELPPSYTNVVLAPWPNRVEDARFRFAGQDFQLEVSEPERGHALHGFTPGRIFTPVGEAGEDSVTLAATVGPEPGWPWPIEVTAGYRIVGHGLEVTLEATNRSGAHAPLALGLHTYLDPQGAPLDECLLETGLDLHQPLDGRLIPVGEPERLDQATWKLHGQQFDDAFAFSSGAPTVTRLVGPDGAGVSLAAAAPLAWQQIFTSPERWLAVEPMTAPPNALASGTDLAVLAPGASLRARLSIDAVTPSDRN